MGEKIKSNLLFFGVPLLGTNAIEWELLGNFLAMCSRVPSVKDVGIFWGEGGSQISMLQDIRR